MGAWGTGPFDNDEALDWAVDLEEQGPRAIERALAAVCIGGRDKRIPADEAEVALAAAEVVRVARGDVRGRLPGDVRSWLRTSAFAPSPSVARLAARAASR